MFLLTRYFLDSLFGRQLLDEEGIVGLRRVLISAGAGIASVGMLLPRLFHQKFMGLDLLPNPEPYRQAMLADGLLMICLVIMLAAFIAALVAPSMFPDEVDYVSLTPLPLPRRRIFGAKLLALALFAGAFILAGLLLFAVSFPVFTQGLGYWAEHGVMARTLSFTIAAAAGSVFAFAGVMAVQGLILVALPRGWGHRASMIVQSAAIAGLIISVPFVYQVTIQSAWLWGRPAELAYFPPGWFLGLEQMLVGSGDPYFAALARIGLWALAGVALAAVGSYAWLYRSAERLISRPPSALARRATANKSGSADRASGLPAVAGRAKAGVWMFIATTLARNRLPQLVFLIAWAVGLAIAANSLYGGLRPTLMVNDFLVPPDLGAVVSMPLVVTLMAVAGLRAAMLLPIGLSANWVFRMTDWPEARADRLNAVEQAFVRLALLPALAISAPVQIAVLGVPRGLAALLLATLASAVLLELILIGWRRVPFTCTWLPGKRPLPLAVSAMLFVLWVTAAFADIVAIAITRGPLFVAILSVILLAAGGVIRWWRRRSWARSPLEFEDEDPARVQQLGLGPS